MRIKKVLLLLLSLLFDCSALKTYTNAQSGDSLCTTAPGKYSSQALALLPGLRSTKGFERDKALYDYDISFTKAQLDLLNQAFADPCLTVGITAVKKTAEWQEPQAIQLLTKAYYLNPGLREPVLWGLIGRKSSCSDQSVREIALKSSAPGTEEPERRFALAIISCFNDSTGMESMLAALQDESEYIRLSPQMDYFARNGDEKCMQRLQEIYASSSDDNVKNNIRHLFVGLPYELVENSGTTKINTSTVPIQTLSIEVSATSHTIVFPLPIISKTGTDIYSHGNAGETELSFELKNQIQLEYKHSTNLGDRYRINLGGDKWISGVLADYKAATHDCGVFLSGVLSIKGMKDRALLSSINVRTVYVEKETSLLSASTNTVGGILKEIPISESEAKELELALNKYLMTEHKNWVTECQESDLESEKCDLISMSKMDGKLKLKTLPVDLGKNNVGYIISALWGKTDDAYASFLGFAKKAGLSFTFIPIRARRTPQCKDEYYWRDKLSDIYTPDLPISNVVDFNSDGLGDLIIGGSNLRLLEFTGDSFNETKIGYSGQCDI